MASRIFKSNSWTATAVADGANFTNLQFMALQGASGTQRTLIQQLMFGGQAGASAPIIGVFSRDSLIGVTLTALGTGESDAPIDPGTVALAAPVVPFTQSTTKPQRSATLGLGNFSFNAFGGGFLWNAPPYKEFVMIGNTASFGEASFSAFTGTTAGAIGGHIMYETL